MRYSESGILSVAVSPDGRRVVVGGIDPTIRIWDLTDLGAAPVLLHNDDRVFASVALSPDGRFVVAGGADPLVFPWHLRVEDLIDLAKRTAGRNLTLAEWRLYFPDLPYHRTFPGLPDPDGLRARPPGTNQSSPEEQKTKPSPTPSGPEQRPDSPTQGRAVARRSG
ncbi:MAG TPA: hypothetical protein VKA15_22845 [Isosphaeraceae bacterium]|nr:hypothetical protein [Isosphaeraceae bacterium]